MRTVTNVRASAPTFHPCSIHFRGTLVIMDQRTYDDRVRSLEEELGIPTSDAQAMVEAEDFLDGNVRKPC